MVDQREKFHEERKHQAVVAAKAALRNSLRIRNNRVSIINADPSSRLFVVWFAVSCYFPVITACLGPIGNTISIACVVDKWREVGPKRDVNGNITGNEINDPTSVMVLNIISLVLGFTSNIVLFLHFARKLSYLKSQVINIFGWTAAGILLLVDVIYCSATQVHHGQRKTIGFWYACFTSGLYFCCSINLTIHFIGYKMRKYPPTFNLLPSERSIMVFTVLLSLWLIWGAGMFCGLLDITFGNALYYSVVSLLTVGLGDILPTNVASKIMVLIFSLSGIIILGLIVFMTRSIIQNSSGPVWYYHRLERKRVQVWHKILKNELDLTDEESFNYMIKIRKVSKIRENIYSVCTTVIVFCIFWLIGALIFYFAETWNYFNCMYFSFLCLLTIGYGDYAPVTGVGRAFFVIWALGAVPLMGAIISTVGDLLYSLSNSIDFKLGEKFQRSISYIQINSKWGQTSLDVGSGEMNDTEEDDSLQESKNSKGKTHIDDLENIVQEYKGYDLSSDDELYDEFESDTQGDIDIIPPLNELSTTVDRLDEVLRNESRMDISKLKKLRELLKVLRKLHKISIEDKMYELNYQQWSNLHELFPEKNLLHDKETKNFWLSEKTPLKYPLNETNFAFLRLSKAVEEYFDDIIIVEEQKLRKLTERRRSILSTRRNSLEAARRRRRSLDETRRNSIGSSNIESLDSTRSQPLSLVLSRAIQAVNGAPLNSHGNKKRPHSGTMDDMKQEEKNGKDV